MENLRINIIKDFSIIRKHIFNIAKFTDKGEKTRRKANYTAKKKNDAYIMKDFIKVNIPQYK